MSPLFSEHIVTTGVNFGASVKVGVGVDFSFNMIYVSLSYSEIYSSNNLQFRDLASTKAAAALSYHCMHALLQCIYPSSPVASVGAVIFIMR